MTDMSLERPSDQFVQSSVAHRDLQSLYLR